MAVNYSVQTKLAFYMVTKFKSYLLQRTSLVHAIFTHREQVWAIFTHRGQVYAPHFISLWRYLHVDDKFVGAWVCIKLYFFYINICLLGFCISKYTYAMLTKLTPGTPGPSLHEKKYRITPTWQQIIRLD
jgi:hypothetical protein